MPRSHRETHLIQRVGWLRASVLGANDGIVSTASLIVGVAAAAHSPGDVLVAGIAGLVAGAMSMAAGEYVSVSSQADAEAADLAKEGRELDALPESELQELTQIYVDRGVDPALARQVAAQMMAKDPLGAHARDELGISDIATARPVQAALASAAAFTTGAALPVIVAAVAPARWTTVAVATTTLLLLALLGAVGARAGGASVWKPVARVTFWGALALSITAGIGRIFGVMG